MTSILYHLCLYHTRYTGTSSRQGHTICEQLLRNPLSHFRVEAYHNCCIAPQKDRKPDRYNRTMIAWLDHEVPELQREWDILVQQTPYVHQIRLMAELERCTSIWCCQNIDLVRQPSTTNLHYRQTLSMQLNLPVSNRGCYIASPWTNR